MQWTNIHTNPFFIITSIVVGTIIFTFTVSTFLYFDPQIRNLNYKIEKHETKIVELEELIKKRDLENSNYLHVISEKDSIIQLLSMPTKWVNPIGWQPISKIANNILPRDNIGEMWIFSIPVPKYINSNSSQIMSTNQRKLKFILTYANGGNMTLVNTNTYIKPKAGTSPKPPKDFNQIYRVFDFECSMNGRYDIQNGGSYIIDVVNTDGSMEEIQIIIKGSDYYPVRSSLLTLKYKWEMS